jgi:hypothetical protein
MFKALDNYYIARLSLKKHFEKKDILVSFLSAAPDLSGKVNTPVSLSIWKEKNASGDEFSLYGMSEAF